MSNGLPDPQPGEMWTTSKGRTVEILARDEVCGRRGIWDDPSEVDTIAYKFLGGGMVHLRSVSSIGDWTRTEFE